MKLKILFVFCAVLMSFAFTSCDVVGGNCEVCCYMSTDSATGDITYSDEAEYCDAELIAVKATKPVTSGTVTTKIKCY